MAALQSEQDNIKQQAEQLRAEQDKRRQEAQEQALRDLERENLSEEELNRHRAEIRARIENERQEAERLRQEVCFLSFLKLSRVSIVSESLGKRSPIGCDYV
jgi:hypothetical protein